MSNEQPAKFRNSGRQATSKTPRRNPEPSVAGVLPERHAIGSIISNCDTSADVPEYFPQLISGCHQPQRVPTLRGLVEEFPKIQVAHQEAQSALPKAEVRMAKRKKKAERFEKITEELDKTWSGPGWLPPDVRSKFVLGAPSGLVITSMAKITVLARAHGKVLSSLWAPRGLLREIVDDGNNPPQFTGPMAQQALGHASRTWGTNDSEVFVTDGSSKDEDEEEEGDDEDSLAGEADPRPDCHQPELQTHEPGPAILRDDPVAQDGDKVGSDLTQVSEATSSIYHPSSRPRTNEKTKRDQGLDVIGDRDEEDFVFDESDVEMGRSNSIQHLPDLEGSVLSPTQRRLPKTDDSISSDVDLSIDGSGITHALSPPPALGLLPTIKTMTAFSQPRPNVPVGAPSDKVRSFIVGDNKRRRQTVDMTTESSELEEESDDSSRKRLCWNTLNATKLYQQLTTQSMLTDDVFHFLCIAMLADQGSQEKSIRLVDTQWFTDQCQPDRLPRDLPNFSDRSYICFAIHHPEHWALAFLEPSDRGFTLRLHDSWPVDGRSEEDPKSIQHPTPNVTSQSCPEQADPFTNVTLRSSNTASKGPVSQQLSFENDLMSRSIVDLHTLIDGAEARLRKADHVREQAALHLSCISAPINQLVGSASSSGVAEAKEQLALALKEVEVSHEELEKFRHLLEAKKNFGELLLAEETVARLRKLHTKHRENAEARGWLASAE
ncbi:hypothetical protein CEP53_014072 [Fusarium sp. AF-6]|nr:hypothetical protein CEP53_014072 [Fusarium sp. AF-6]